MSSFIMITGNLVRDPEMVHDSNGNIQCRFTVAVDNGKKPDGTTDTNFYDCRLYGMGSEFFFKHSQKTTRVLIMGAFKAVESVREDGSSKQRLRIKVSSYELIDKMRDWPPVPSATQGLKVDVTPAVIPATGEAVQVTDDTI